ncbi:unnamed protein product, partial [Rotaria sp. Silwood1]
KKQHENVFQKNPFRYIEEQKQKYAVLKQHAQEKLNEANSEIERLRRVHTSDIGRRYHRDEEYKHVTPKFKPFDGTSNTVDIAGAQQNPYKSSMVSPGNTTLNPSDGNNLEMLAEICLKTSSSSTTIRLRISDVSKPICVKIDLNRTLDDIRKFLTENVQSLRSNAFKFMEPPSTKINREDERKKSDTKLSNSTLVVRQTA